MNSGPHACWAGACSAEQNTKLEILKPALEPITSPPLRKKRQAALFLLPAKH
jgi:hypothetical protein